MQEYAIGINLFKAVYYACIYFELNSSFFPFDMNVYTVNESYLALAGFEQTWMHRWFPCL